jgi:tetratricopeptide (TPR) repeat protein
MIDTATAKQLLQSSDVVELKSSIKSSRDYLANEANSIDGLMQLQLIKLQVLLYNRLLQLQTADQSTSQADIATTYAGIAYCWNLMSDGEKCQGQLKKSLCCDRNCIEALLLQSELHSGQARFESAIEEIQKVIAIMKEKKDPPKYGLVEALLKMSSIREMMGNFDDAVMVLKDAIAEFKSGDTDTGNDDTKEIRLIKIELYGRLGTIQDKLALYSDAIESLTVAVAELRKCHGDKHPKTQELAYILDMAISAKNG